MMRRLGRASYLAGAAILFAACLWLWQDRRATEGRLRDNDVRDAVSVRDRRDLRAQIREGRAQREVIKADQVRMAADIRAFLAQSKARHDQTQALLREAVERLGRIEAKLGKGEGRP